MTPRPLALTDALAAIMEPLYGFTSLHAFKRKFKPRTQFLGTWRRWPDPPPRDGRTG